MRRIDFEHTKLAIALAFAAGVSGDVFRAGFIYGVLQGWAVPEILRFANAAAAVCCTRLGAVPSVPSLADVLRQPSS
jgi:fructose-1-phosphate kinase PfkB-like protein